MIVAQRIPFPVDRPYRAEPAFAIVPRAARKKRATFRPMLTFRLRALSSLALFGAALGANACSSDDEPSGGAGNGGDDRKDDREVDALLRG